MKRILPFFTVILLSFNSFCQSDKRGNYYLLLNDSSRYLYGYKNQSGDTIIKLGKYFICYTDTFYNCAIVFNPSKGFIGINKSEKVLFKVLSLGDRPDKPSDGLIRIIKNGKIGFADTNGNIVIKPQYKLAYPFKDGKTSVLTYSKGGIHYGHWYKGYYYWIDINRTRDLLLHPLDPFKIDVNKVN